VHKTTPEEGRRWLAIEPSEDPEALIFMGALDFPQVLASWSRRLSEPRTGAWPNVVVGSLGGHRLAVAAGYGAAVAGDIAHICCTLGVRAIIVTGFCGGLQRGIEYRDVVIATRGHPMDSVARHYLDGAEQAHASLEVVEWLTQRCAEEEIPHHVGPVVSAASIMTETEDHFAEWQQAGFYGVDLEVAVLFAVAHRFKVKCGALLAQSDSPVEGVYIATRRSDEDRKLMSDRQFQIGRLALEAATKFSKDAKGG
jgi:purine-nucleoside phosphorylase